MTLANPAKTLAVPSTMKAWVLGNPDELKLVDKPVPQPAAAEVLVRIDAIAVCATDLEVIHSGPPALIQGGDPFNKNFTPGHEYMGTVVKLGPGVDEFEVGDRVAVEIHAGCGRCGKNRDSSGACRETRCTGAGSARGRHPALEPTARRRWLGGRGWGWSWSRTRRGGSGRSRGECGRLCLGSRGLARRRHLPAGIEGLVNEVGLNKALVARPKAVHARPGELEILVCLGRVLRNAEPVQIHAAQANGCVDIATVDRLIEKPGGLRVVNRCADPVSIEISQSIGSGR